MLKVTEIPEERRGMRVMAWWDGEGAAKVYRHGDGALLMERAVDPRGLTARTDRSGDDEATQILCEVAARLHAPRSTPEPELQPLHERFEALRQRSGRGGDFFGASAVLAERLLASQRDVVPLHGDLHHGNVLEFDAGEWRAIDPKGVVGERAFDFANIFCNPTRSVAVAPGRVARLADLVASCASIERRRLVEWAVAWCGLSAAWTLADGGWPDVALDVGAAALAEMTDKG